MLGHHHSSAVCSGYAGQLTGHGGQAGIPALASTTAAASCPVRTESGFGGGMAGVYGVGMPFVYHLCPVDMHGHTLLPLNRLKVERPDLYDRELRKWDGRESVLTWVVPHLGVPWADTVNLSALDPRQLADARRRLGLPLSKLLERRIARIPIDRIADAPAVVYDSASHWINSAPGEDVPLTPPEREFTPFDPTTYRELPEVPALHLDYLRRQLAAGRPALGFVFVRHVLVGGPVDLSGIQLVAVDDRDGAHREDKRQS
jgi:hypothetical protein